MRTNCSFKIPIGPMNEPGSPILRDEIREGDAGDDDDDDGSFEPAPKDFNAMHWLAIGREEPQGPLVAMLGEMVFLA